MDLSYGPEIEQYRGEVRAFLSQHLGTGEGLAVAEFRNKAVQSGYLYRAVPRRLGGSEQPADPLRAQVIREEFARAGAPGEVGGVGVALLVPTLLAHGTEEQRDRFIPPTLSGDLRWCQGYSEPDAGSDLESLRTTAVLDGESWVINGQKVWTSTAARADYMFLLARTDPSRPRRDGLTYLLMPMDQPGVQVRPIRQLNGVAEFDEVFLTDARAPRDMVVGSVGAGWTVSRTTLSHERGALTGPAQSGALFASLVKLARRSERDGRPALSDPAVRDALAELAGWVEAHRLAAYTTASRDLRGAEQGILGLMNKQMLTDITARVAAVAVDLLGDASLLDPVGSAEPGDERWLNQFFGSLGMAVAGGTSHIQRNIISERGLGLPRDRTGR